LPVESRMESCRCVKSFEGNFSEGCHVRALCVIWEFVDVFICNEIGGIGVEDGSATPDPSKMVGYNQLTNAKTGHLHCRRNHSILPLNQLNNPFVPSRSHTRLWGTRNVFPSTKKTSSGNNPSSAGNFPISLSLKSSSSNFHAGTSLFPLNNAASPWNPSSSVILFPFSLRCFNPFLPGVARTSAESASAVSEELVSALCERVSVRRLGKSLVRRGRMDSVERGGVTEPEFEAGRVTLTRSAKPQLSRSSSSRLGKKDSWPSTADGSAKVLSMRRFVRMSTLSVCAND